MQVILREDFLALGYIGDTVSVRRGYARNFLIPRGIAIEVSGSNQRLVKHHLAAIAQKRAKLRAAAEEESKKVKAVKLDFTLKLGEKGRAFGSITTKDIAEALAAKGMEIDRRRIRLTEALRSAGEYIAQIRLHAEVIVPLSIVITEEKPVVAAKAAEEGEEKPKRRRTSKKAAEQADAAGEGAAEDKTSAE